MALDTGATHSFVDTKKLENLGYQPNETLNRATVTTGSGEAYAPVLQLIRIQALGQVRESFSVTVIDLPPSATVEGVIGLDFLRGGVLTLDFREGKIDLDGSS